LYTVVVFETVTPFFAWVAMTTRPSPSNVLKVWFGTSLPRSAALTMVMFGPVAASHQPL
jgi:hypothetical protein